MRTYFIIAMVMIIFIGLTGCNNGELPELDLEENQQVFYLYEDGYVYMDVNLAQGAEFESKTMAGFLTSLDGEMETVIQEYFDRFHMINAKSEVLLTNQVYESYKDLQMTVLDVLGNGYKTSYSVPGEIIAVGSDSPEATYNVKDNILELVNTGDSALITILYKDESKTKSFKKIEKDHGYYELASNGNMQRFAAYLPEKELFYLGSEVTLGQLIKEYYKSDYTGFFEQVSLVYVSDNRVMSVEDIMQEAVVNVEVFQTGGRTTYIRVPGEVVFINRAVPYTIEDGYIVIADTHIGDVMIGYSK